jgi:hypothetical protein
MVRKKPYQRRKKNHADAEHPDDACQDVVRVIEVQRPRHTNDGELEQHEERARGSWASPP